MEFSKSLASATLYAILDDSGDNLVISGFDTQRTTNSLPVNFPFDLAVISDSRKAFDISNLGSYRKVQFKLTSASSKLKVKFPRKLLLKTQLQLLVLCLFLFR